ncbi:phosphotransferase enzyme family protein [Penicillium alfredii]|uniref:Phosphotransferase enzyme family protein n=1 Tax=Penicillium alfredii TaxID=1506179 RepID=A0A9W9F1Z8_9EURO|nr:phosphotransferase enzyme family protein [Penicillium alfredii]KAJ5092135.1 phosphotransferase enzyme family protein [Penicillium alfredii]
MMNVFFESSFFQTNKGIALPTPSEIRAINEASGDFRKTYFHRAAPVKIPSLGLFVKYGRCISIVEAKTQRMLHTVLKDRVPVPEVFGWAEDGGQAFIYMALIEGDMLMERWDGLNEGEKQSICHELKYMVQQWRGLQQDVSDSYIGSFDDSPLQDIFLLGHPECAGPWRGADAVRQFQSACEIDASSDAPIRFTHSDLLPPNILLSPGPTPKVAAIIDWAQAGWYPAYWEYCKARWINLAPEHFDGALLDEWRRKYLPLFLDPVDDETEYHPWVWFVLSKGI